MKFVRKSRIYFAAILPLLIVIGFAGCASAPTVEYQVTASTATVVDTAMQAYGALYKAGQIPPEIATKVEQAYGIYQQAMQANISAFQAYQAIAAMSNAAPADVSAAQAKAQAALQDATSKVVSLFLVLQNAGVQQSVLAPVLTPATPTK